MTTSDPNACMQCGLCNTVDPIQSVVRKETSGTRFKLIMAKQGKPSALFYLTTETGLQEAICPAHIEISNVLRAMREKCVQEGITTNSNETMVANFKKSGIPYADLKHEDWHGKPVW